MNTKKITALALAALMAAGSTATSFAVNNVVDAGNDLSNDRPLTFKDMNIYEEDDGVLKKSNDFRPGDTLYIRLDELSTTDKKVEDEKDDMKVYADWKVGKDAVKSIDIVYRKGEAVTTGSPVAGSKYYTVNIGGKSLDVVVDKDNGETLNAAVKRELIKAMKDDANFLKKEREADLVAAKKVDGFVVDGAWVESGYASKKGGFKVGNIYKDADQADEYATARFTVEGSGKTFYLATGATDFGKASFNKGDGYESSNATPDSDYKLDGSADVVNFVKVSYLPNVKKADLVAMGLAEDVTENVIVADGSGEIKDDARIVEADKPAYVVDGETYEKVEDAQNAVIEKIAADEATELAPAARAVIDSTIDSVAKPDFTYWVEIKTKDNDTTKVLDLAGVLRIGSTKNKAEKVDNQFQLDTSLDNRVYDSNNKYVVVEDEWTFEPDSRSVVKFDKDAEDVVLYFGENEAAWYEFDARGQDALNLEFTFDFNKEIADLFPKANIDFLTFTSKPATNRTGDLYITADEDTFLYEVTEDGVKEIQGAKYNEEEGAWHIRTRKLGAYAISDIELDTSVKVEGKDDASSNSSTSSKPNGDKHNPDTGR